MSDPSLRFDELIASLKARDLRLTPQRVELVRLIAASDGHPSAAQLHARIKRRFPTMSHATVYKTLSLLKDMGQVQEIDLHGDSRYDGSQLHPHPHLICLQCKRICDGEADLTPAAIRRLEHASGYRILRFQISLFGLCPECRPQPTAARSKPRRSQ
jgi:Fur family peroxide stress response transcriptional regulator